MIGLGLGGLGLGGQGFTVGDWLTLYWRIGESLTDWSGMDVLFADW